jgi:hypothetical protein
MAKDVDLQVEHLAFFQAILGFLQAFHAGEEEQKKTLKQMRKAGDQFLKLLPEPHKKGDVDLRADLDKIYGFADGYYPDLEGSDSLQQAIEQFSHHLQSEFKVAPI